MQSEDQQVDIDHGGYPFACYDCANRYEAQPDEEVCSSCGGPIVGVVPLYGLALDGGDTCSSMRCSKPAIWEAEQMDGDIPKCAGHAAGFKKSQLTMIVDAERPDVEAADQETAAEPTAVDDTDPQLVAGDGGEPQPQQETQVQKEPQAPQALPKYLVDGVEKQSPEELRDLAAYAERMAEWMEAEAQRELEARADQSTAETPEEWDDDEWQDAVDDAREEADIPASKGTLTTKTIDGRDYYYLQWRDGSKIRSQYVAPVTPANDE